MTGNTDKHLLATDVGPWVRKNSRYLVWPPFASYSGTHLLHIELTRLLIVACGMLSHSTSMAVRSCWILAGTGARWSKESQTTCSKGDTSEYAGHFQLPGIVYRSLRHEAVHYHAETWGDGGKLMARQWASGSCHSISVHSNCHQ